MLSVLLFSLKPKLFSNEVGVQQWLQTGHHQAWQIQLEQLRAVHSPAPDACLSFVSLSFFLSVCLSVCLSVWKQWLFRHNRLDSHTALYTIHENIPVPLVTNSRPNRRDCTDTLLPNVTGSSTTLI